MAKPGRKPRSREQAARLGSKRGAKVLRLPLPPGLVGAGLPPAGVPAPAVRGEPSPPAWLPEGARERWAHKLARYRERGQSIAGFEDAFCFLCVKEAELIERSTLHASIPGPELSAYRVYAEAFYETPASAAAALVASAAKPNAFAAAEAAKWSE